jgi:predicted Fe-Mo cluster-binding NifX family protein
MKIAITSSGNSLESELDEYFGRCSYFVFYDTVTKSLEFIPNPNKDLTEEAGTECAKFLAVKKAVKVITGELGIKVKPVLDSLRIQAIVLNTGNKTVKNIIDMITNNN